jgi:hypothetical protein
VCNGALFCHLTDPHECLDTSIHSFATTVWPAGGRAVVRRPAHFAQGHTHARALHGRVSAAAAALECPAMNDGIMVLLFIVATHIHSILSTMWVPPCNNNNAEYFDFCYISPIITHAI